MRPSPVPSADIVRPFPTGASGPGAPDPAAHGTGLPGGQRGTVLVWLPALLLLATLVAVVLIELGGHLVAISRASALADSAALAAVSAEASTRPEAPHTAARRVVETGGGRLEACDCPPGARRVRVRVSVEVPGVLVPRLGAGRQGAEARAVLRAPGVAGSSDGGP